jgi:hypothetical protein
MSAKSTYFASKLISHVLGGPDFVRPGTIYLALYTADPRVDNTTELSGNGYARSAIPNVAASWTADGAGGVVSAVEVSFPGATSAWAAFSFFGLLDAPTGGNLLYAGELAQALNVGSGEQLRIAAGDIIVKEE